MTTQANPNADRVERGNSIGVNEYTNEKYIEAASLNANSSANPN